MTTAAPASKDAHIFARAFGDWYQEPERCTSQLCDAERFTGAVHDPSCGGGNTIRALRRAGYEATGSDIVQRGEPGAPWYLGEMDFLTGWAGLYGADNCVSNPPYDVLEAWIRRALDVTPGKVCVFTRLAFLAGGGRANGLYRDMPPNRVWVITPRPSCPPGEFLEDGGKAQGDTKDYAWLVWEGPSLRHHAGTPALLGWLR